MMINSNKSLFKFQSMTRGYEVVLRLRQQQLSGQRLGTTSKWLPLRWAQSLSTGKSLYRTLTIPL